MKQEYINKEWLLEMLEGRYERNEARDAIDVGHKAEIKLLMDMLKGTRGLELEEYAASYNSPTIFVNDMSDTFQFFTKLFLKASKSFQTALNQGKATEAENINKKLVHYMRALGALRIVANGGQNEEKMP